MYECVPKKMKSKKGNEFVCLEVTFPNGYKKIVFLDNAETYMALADIVQNG